MSHWHQEHNYGLEYYLFDVETETDMDRIKKMCGKFDRIIFTEVIGKNINTKCEVSIPSCRLCVNVQINFLHYNHFSSFSKTQPTHSIQNISSETYHLT